MQSRRTFLTRFAGLVAAPAVSKSAAAGLVQDGNPASPTTLDPTLPDRDFWRSVASQFNLDPEQHFFNPGTLGSCPRPVRQRVTETLDKLDARPTYQYWAKCMPRYFEVRAKAARLLGVETPQAITLTHSTTEGINIIARGLDLQPGDEVVTTTHEHPGGDAVWRYLEMKKGIRLKRCAMPMVPPSNDEIVSGLERLITPRTRVLMVSHILYTNGLIMPVRRIGQLASDRGLYYLIDGAHPVGQMPVEIESTGCSFYAASAHKWLCAPKGTGFLYVRPDLLDRVEPLLTAYDPQHIPEDVRSFEAGTTRLNFVWTNNMDDIMGLEAAIDFHQEIGAKRVQQRCLDLTRQFRRGLAGMPGLEMIEIAPESRSCPMTTFKLLQGSNKQAFRDLKALGYTTKEVFDSELPEPINALRVCTHIFNSEAQVDGLLAAIEQTVAGAT